MHRTATKTSYKPKVNKQCYLIYERLKAGAKGYGRVWRGEPSEHTQTHALWEPQWPEEDLGSLSTVPQLSLNETPRQTGVCLTVWHYTHTTTRCQILSHTVNPGVGFSLQNITVVPLWKMSPLIFTRGDRLFYVDYTVPSKGSGPTRLYGYDWSNNPIFFSYIYKKETCF